jgi:hypothetical protein
MIQTISSKSTFFYKFILYPFLISALGYIAFPGLFFGKVPGLPVWPREFQFVLIIFWFIICLISWLDPCIRFKRIRLDEKNFYISNYFAEIQVPLLEIISVSENRWHKMNPVTLKFKNDTPFGTSVVFAPTERGFFASFKPHPVVKEIMAGVERAKIGNGFKSEV